ncbi:DUF4364 family protein [Eubacteriales bacterium OttesenSCG-928-M02]|nr:DUF4364 family protein [Eubacteriales bacterium OttesenSCG-928-M02]
MPFVTDDVTRTKLILLYLFQKVHMPLTREQIILAMGPYDQINQFELTAALSDLVETGMVALVGINATLRYHIVPMGQETLDLFYTEIPISIRKDLDGRKSEIRALARRESEYVSDYKKIAEGIYEVELRIMERDTALLEIRLMVDSLSQASAVAKNWQNSASQVYGTLLAPVTRDPNA